MVLKHRVDHGEEVIELRRELKFRKSIVTQKRTERR